MTGSPSIPTLFFSRNLHPYNPLSKRTEGLLSGISKLHLKFNPLDHRAAVLKQLQCEMMEPSALRWAPQGLCDIKVDNPTDRKVDPTIKITWENEEEFELDVTRINYPTLVQIIQAERSFYVIAQEAKDAEMDEAEDSTDSILQQSHKNWSRDKQISWGFDPDNEIKWADHLTDEKTRWFGDRAVQLQEERIEKFKKIYFPQRQLAASLKRLRIAEKGNWILDDAEMRWLGRRCSQRVARVTNRREEIVKKHGLKYYF